MKQKVRRTGNLWAMKPPPFVGAEMIFPCKDGYVNYLIQAGKAGARFNPPLIKWMEYDGICVDALKEIKWEELDMIDFPKELRDRFADILRRFFLKHTKKELEEESTKRRVLLFPVFTMEDIMKHSQLKHRDFWVEVEHPELGITVPYPGPCAKTNDSLPKTPSRPPQIGEHNLEIYEEELAYSREDLAILKAEGVI